MKSRITENAFGDHDPLRLIYSRQYKYMKDTGSRTGSRTNISVEWTKYDSENFKWQITRQRSIVCIRKKWNDEVLVWNRIVKQSFNPNCDLAYLLWLKWNVLLIDPCRLLRSINVNAQSTFIIFLNIGDNNIIQSEFLLWLHFQVSTFPEQPSLNCWWNVRLYLLKISSHGQIPKVALFLVILLLKISQTSWMK